MDAANRWILELPSFENGLTFDPLAAQLLQTLMLIVAGLILTYVGLRAVKTVVLIGAAALGGWAGVILLHQLTDANELLDLIFFVTMAFFGACGFYFLSILWNGFLSLLGFHGSVERWLWPVAPLLGGAALGGTVFLRIYRWTPLAVGIGVFFALTGLLVQSRSKHRRRAFHTYEEIYRMKQKGGTAGAGSEPEGTEIPS